MGLSAWLLRRAASAPRPLIVGVPYGTQTRLSVEAELARRGWVQALSPAEASMLVVCGNPGEELDQAIQQVWAAIPTPRALVQSPTDVAQALDAAQSHLSDAPAQWHDAANRLTFPDMHDISGNDDTPSEHGHDTPDGRGHDMQGEHDMQSGGGHGGGMGHEHHMGSPGGLKMAERADDRDGLKLDQLHLPLGPILPDWPTGLVVDTLLQGDVIQQATVRIVTPASTGTPFWDQPWIAAEQGIPVTRGQAERRIAARHLDSLGRLLAVAGWPTEAARARRLRDQVLQGGTPKAEFARFARRVGNSRTLRWMLRDVPPTMDAWLARTTTALDTADDDSPLGNRRGLGRGLLAVLPELLEGKELATARLIVAALDPDVEQVLHD